jgi:hypothetical protein
VLVGPVDEHTLLAVGNLGRRQAAGAGAVDESGNLEARNFTRARRVRHGRAR